MSKPRFRWIEMTAINDAQLGEKLMLGPWLLYECRKSGDAYMVTDWLPKLQGDKPGSQQWRSIADLPRLKACCERNAYKWLSRVGLADGIRHPNDLYEEPVDHPLSQKKRAIKI